MRPLMVRSPITNTVGDRLRRSRKTAGLSAQQMAVHMRRSRNTISRWENDEVEVDLRWLEEGDRIIDLRRPA